MKTNTNGIMPKKWYKKGWVIALLIFLFLVFIGMIGGGNKGGVQEGVKDGYNQPKEVNKPEAKEVGEKLPAKNEAQPSSPLNDEDQIKQLVSDKLQGNNDSGKAYIIKIEVMKQIDDGWGVFTEYNADDKLNVSLRKEGIETKMADIYTALYTSGKNISTASVTAYFPTVDKYGNSSDSVVYKSMLEKKEADKVNWNADKSMLQLQILPKVWTTTVLNRDFIK